MVSEDRILSWAEGYDGIVGHHAGRLSQGERQRLGIARLLIKRPVPKIVILDEFNSHLDPASNETIWKTIDAHLYEFFCFSKVFFFFFSQLFCSLDDCIDLLFFFVLWQFGVDDHLHHAQLGPREKCSFRIVAPSRNANPANARR
jgi:hypothetical protein